MPRTNITEFSNVASENTDINSINIAENCPASGINNALRELMKALKDVDTGSQALTALSVTGDLTVDTSTLKVDSSNNRVGVGTASPAINLETSGSMGVSDTSTATKRLQLDSGASEHTINSANYGSDMMDLNIQAENLILKTGLVGVAERMRINSDGNVGIGTNSPDRDLVFGGGGGGSGVDIHDVGSTGQIRIGKTVSGTTSAMIFKNSNSTVGTINFSDVGTSYNATSDYRLKENVTYDFDATSRLKQLKPARFNFKIDKNITVDGFLAHEVSSIVPEAISGEKDAMTEEVLYVDGDEIPEGKKIGDVKEASQIDPQGIDQSKLVPLLVKTIQELEARITALENA